jgi:hypothetical protein
MAVALREEIKGLKYFSVHGLGPSADSAVGTIKSTWSVFAGGTIREGIDADEKTPRNDKRRTIIAKPEHERRPGCFTTIINHR